MQANSAPLMPSRPRQKLRRRLLVGAEKLLYWSGACSAYARLNKSLGAVILMYHSVVQGEIAAWIDPDYALPVEDFRRQMRFLASRHHVVSMHELVEASTEGRDMPSGTVVITFDDGYRDNATIAAPILDEYRLPATFYLATGYVERGEPQWIDRLYGAFRHRSRHGLDLRSHGFANWDLGRRPAVEAAHHELACRLLGDHWQQRRVLLDEIDRQLQPTDDPPRTTMGWGEARQLAANPLFEIGGHSRDHIDLSTCNAEQVRVEVEGCLADLQRELGRRTEHFSYPYGRGRPEVRDLLQGAGIKSATMTQPGRPIRHGDDVFAWTRFNGQVDPTMFRLTTSGALPRLPMAVFGRA